jgi:hypothetical protein
VRQLDWEYMIDDWVDVIEAAKCHTLDLADRTTQPAALLTRPGCLQNGPTAAGMRRRGGMPGGSSALS